MFLPPQASSRTRCRTLGLRRPAGGRRHSPAVEALEPYVLMAVNVFDVTTTADSGAGSLRAAMTQANATAGPSEIDFQIPGNGPVRIMVGSATAGAALPTIQGTLFINGYSEGDFQQAQSHESGGGDTTPYAGPPLVVIDGTDATGTNGFDLGPGAAPNANSDGSQIQGLAIDRFNSNESGAGGTGIVIEPTSTGDIISGNYIGIDYADGSTASFQGNSNDGVLVQSGNNTIGGTTPADRNVLSGNDDSGVEVQFVSSGGSDASNNVIEGNYIGTDATGATAHPDFYGVTLEGVRGTTIGGATAAAGNVISGNRFEGVTLTIAAESVAFSSDTVIQGNYIGTNAAGTAALPNQGFGILNVDADHTLIGGPTSTEGAAPGNLISGNGSIGESGGSDTGGGIDLTTNNRAAPAPTYVDVEGDLIGTDHTGKAAIPNSEGIVIDGSPNNTIGGVAPGTRNVISGNGFSTSFDGGGVIIIGTGSRNDSVLGNYIGTDITGDAPLGNYGRGVYIGDGSDLHRSGDGVASDDSVILDVIAANGQLAGDDGVELQGTSAVPTTGDTVNDALIGDYANSTHSGVSGNGEDGVHARYATGAIISNDTIAYEHRDGVSLEFAAGATVGANMITYNGDRGISITGTSPGNSITANTIAGNLGGGVVFDTTSGPLTATNGDRISQNSISGNGGLGIAFDGSTIEPTPNTPGVHTSGPNLLQNYPVLASTSIVDGVEVVHGTLASAGPGPFTVEVFSNPVAGPSGYGQGQSFLASAQVTLTNGVGTFDLAIGASRGGFLAATATDADHNTSEFSADLPSAPTGQMPTTTTLTAAPNPSSFGLEVAFQVAVVATGSQVAPTGSVALLQGMQPLGMATLVGGKATIDLADLPVGTTPIVAVYTGDPTDEPSDSPVFDQVVKPGVTLTSLTSFPNPSPMGSPISFSVTVFPAFPTEGVAGPTGSVTLLQGMQPLGTATLVDGGATVEVDSLPVGTHSIDAVYSGDANYASDASPAINQVVNQGFTSILLTSTPNPSAFGQAVTFTATVSPFLVPSLRAAKAANGKGKAAQASILPTGTVTLLEGMDPIGTGTINAAGQVTIHAVPLVVGTNSIVALYSGDKNFASSESRAYQQVVNRAPSTTTVVASTQSATAGQPIKLTASVGKRNGITPTGRVTFLDGKHPLGSSALNAGGQATLTVASLGVGRHTITAVYGGDATFAASSSTVATVVINPTSADGPRVTGLVRYGFHAQPTIFVLSFNGPLDPARAEDVLNYTLVGPLGGLGRGGSPIAIGQVIYDAAADTVTLLPVRGLNVHYRYTLTINGTGPLGVEGPTGIPLDGAGTGRPGSDYTTIFGRASLVGPARAYQVPSPTHSATAAVVSSRISGALHPRGHLTIH